MKNAEQKINEYAKSKGHESFTKLIDKSILSPECHVELLMEDYVVDYKEALQSIKQIALSRKKGSIEEILKVIGELEK